MNRKEKNDQNCEKTHNFTQIMAPYIHFSIPMHGRESAGYVVMAPVTAGDL